MFFKGNDFELREREQKCKVIEAKQAEEHERQLAEERRLKHFEEDLKRKEIHLLEDFEMREKKVIAAYEDKLAKELNSLKASHSKELADLKAEYQDANIAALEKLMAENYTKLKDSLAKLHDEGNATTKFLTQMSGEMFKAIGLNTKTVNRIEMSKE